MSTYSDYAKARNVGSGKFMWEPMGDVPGFRTKANGGIETVNIPKARVRDAAAGGDQMSFSISRGQGDRRHKIALSESMLEAKKEVARGRNPVSVFLDSGLSGATFGGTSAMGNWIAGEGAAEARGMSMEHHPMAHLMGRIAGVAALGAAPILQGASRSAGLANAGSIFEVAGVASQTARGLVTSGGFVADVSRSLLGTLAYGAVAEAPLSVALAMADIVDNDKELSTDMLVTEAGQQFMWGMMIAGATGIPFALGGASVRALGRGAKAGMARIGQTDLMQGLVHGGTRYVARKYLRGQGRGAGDVVETMMHRAGSKMITAASKKNAETAFGRFISGDVGEGFVKAHRTVFRAIEDLGAAKTTKAFTEAAETLGYNVRPGPLADDLAFMANPKNAKNIVEARRFADALPPQAAEISKAISSVRLKAPKGAKFELSRTKDILEDALRVAGNHETGALQKQLLNISLPKNRAQAFSETLQLRRSLSDTGKVHVAKALRGVVDSKTASKLDDILAQADGMDVFRGAVDDLTPRLVEAKGLRSLEELEDLRAATQGLGGSYRGLKGSGVVKNEGVMRGFFDGDELKSSLKIDNEFNDFGKSIEALGRANSAYKELMFDASPLIAAKRPMTQPEILESQLRTVISTKKRIWEAFKYIATKGGGGRHTFAFTGVMVYRNMKTMNEKQEAFAVHRRALLETASNSGAMQDVVGRTTENVAAHDMELGIKFAETLVASNTYLMNQLPQSDDPLIGAMDFSGAEVENFLEAVGAIFDPISVLATAADGSVTGQAVDAIRTVYPDLYAEILVDMAEFLENNRGEIGHEQMLGLDTFAGGALGYLDAPTPELAFQPPYYQTTGAAQSAGAMGGPEQQRMNTQQNTTPAQKVGAM